MAPRVDHVNAGATPPPRTSVVVIGGGIIGVCAAFFLAAKGVATVLCEKGVISGEQSGRNWGWCRKTLRDPLEIPLTIDSMRLWQDMRDRVGVETGFRTTGIMYIAATPDALAPYEAWLEHARQHQLDSRIIGGEEIARLLPGATRQWPGALYTPSDGGAEPSMAAPAIAEAARRHGAVLATACAVRGIETSAGRVSAVVTERGRIACDAVVLAGGAWSRLFCGNIGLNLPQLKVLGSVSRTLPLPGGPEISVAAPGFGFRKCHDGSYIVSQAGATIADIVPDSLRLFLEFLPALRVQWKGLRLRIGRRFLEEWRMPRRWALDEISPFERVRVLDPEPSDTVLDEARQNIAAAYPVFAGMPIAERWGGLIDVTPDALPIISPVEAVPGFYLATGFSGHGFGIGPGVGRLIAAMVTGAGPTVDATPYGLSRFSRRPGHRVKVG